MYVKIEKDYSNNFLILEAKEVEIRNGIFTMAYSEYINGLVIPATENGLERQTFSTIAKDAIKYIYKHATWESIIPVTEYYMGNQDEQCDCNCALKGISVDGKNYITCGNIYVLNDKGQTIQRI